MKSLYLIYLNLTERQRKARHGLDYWASWFIYGNTTAQVHKGKSGTLFNSISVHILC